MIWGRRPFANADFARYQDRLVKLLYANPARYREFMMVSTNTDDPAVGLYYVGVPMEVIMEAFDGFEIVDGNDLPKEIDNSIVADVNSEEFQSHFRFRGR